MLLHLTEVLAPGGRGPRPVRINPEAVASYREPGGTAGVPGGAGTYMSLITGHGLYLSENPEEIDEAWERVYPTLRLEDSVTVEVTEEVDLDQMTAEDTETGGALPTTPEGGVTLSIERRDFTNDEGAWEWVSVLTVHDYEAPLDRVPDYQIVASRG